MKQIEGEDYGEINNNNQSIDVLVKTRYKQLVEKGSYEIGVDPNINPDLPPTWFDKQRFIRSQKTAEKYSLSLKFASFCGLLLGIQIPTFLEPLLVTGHHENVAKLFKRYLETSIKVSSWYTSDPFDESSASYKSLRVVRSMHKSIYKLMNNLTDRQSGRDRLWVSQFQMALTQAGFFGLLILYSKDCGAHGITDDELEDIIYLWRVLGYLNGIQDKYNLCSGGLKETQAYLLHINKQFIEPQINPIPAHPYPIGHQVAQGISDAFRPMQPNIRYHVYLTYWYNIIGIPLPPTFDLTWFHQILLVLMKFTFQKLLGFRLIYNFLNWRTKQRLIWAEKNCSQIEKRLADQYNDKLFKPSSCPFSVTLDSLTHHVVTPHEIDNQQLDDNHNDPLLKSK
ncbi:uncharacterized protein LOC128392975 [Panonychus citri]|uniref:uncharacterized protein LOC128392975 n=1 Tax=Panonychus citri TaxID=50023 RepID=UPI0023073755|nr:uncharacterized protein LOC128392975 [Panonychus citri]